MFSNVSIEYRNDYSKQKGFFLLMVHKNVANGAEGHINVIDWRSWKLAGIARSTLAAEFQASSEAADSLLFMSTFWNFIWRRWLPLDQVETTYLVNHLKLMVDAKALYNLLVRPKLQAINNINKKIIMEVLVSQDKLYCCGRASM